MFPDNSICIILIFTEKIKFYSETFRKNLIFPVLKSNSVVLYYNRER